MKILLSIPSQDTRQEYSRLVELPVVPEKGEVVMVGQMKLVVVARVFQADSDEIQVICESHSISNAADLVKAGWRNTHDEPYHEAVKLAVEPPKPEPVVQDLSDEETKSIIKTKRGKR